MSKHAVQGGDVGELLSRFAHLQEKVRGRTGHLFPIIPIQEAGQKMATEDIKHGERLAVPQ